MNQQIKNRFTNAVIAFGDYETLMELLVAKAAAHANLRSANLRGANLEGANLTRADLEGADLTRADLGCANLRSANLRGANLEGANLTRADLWDASLRSANLTRADLGCANLRSADLRGANLEGADLTRADLGCALLRSANLRGANLEGANLTRADLGCANLTDAGGARLAVARTSIVPEDGPFFGWKKCRDGILVQLEIQSDARRSNGPGRKCRAEHAKVLLVIGSNFGLSTYDCPEELVITYRVGEVVRCHQWNDDRWTECGGGIHFYITRIEAENH